MKRAISTVSIFIVLFMLLSLLPAALFAAPRESVVYLSATNAGDRAMLLSLLNGRQTQSGKQYVLQTNFSFSSSELKDTYFPGKGRESRAQYSTFLSSLDGNGKTIIINVEKDETARPLFHTIGDLAGERVAIKNLKVQYNGDVKVSAFLSGYARNADFSNVDVKVSGNVVASTDYFNSNIHFYAHAFGYSAENCSFKNIKITVGDDTVGGIIGQTPKTITERLSLADRNRSATYAYGFFHDMTNVTVDSVSVKAKTIDATGNAGARAAGFAESIVSGENNQIRSIRIDISDGIYAKEQAYGSAETVGAYGFAGSFDKLVKSSVAAGTILAENKNVLTESRFMTEAAGLGAISAGKKNDIYENSVTVSGDITAASGGLINATGGYLTGASGNGDFYTQDNMISIGGDVRVKGGSLLSQGNGAAANLSVSGLSHGAATLHSENDVVYVAGSLTAESEGRSNVMVAGYASQTGDVKNTVCVIGDIVANAPDANATVSGFAASIKRGSTHQNNYLRVGGKVDVSASKTVDVAGYSASTAGWNVTVNASTVDIGGGFFVDTSHAAPAVMLSGFLSANNGATLKNNVMAVRGNFEVRCDGAEEGEAIAASFLAKMDAGTVSGNAAYHSGSSVIGGSVTMIKSNFAGVLRGGTVAENGILGNAGIEARPKDFLIGALHENASGYSVYNNCYIATHGNERVSHPVGFSVSGETGSMTVEMETLLSPLDPIFCEALSDTSTQLNEKLQGTLELIGAKQSVAMAGSIGTSIVNRSALLKDVSVLPIAGVASQTDDGFVIRDIIGIDGDEAKTVTGLIFYDNDNNARFDSVDSYTPNVTFSIMAYDTAVGSVTTANDGRFSFTMPLVSALSVDYHLHMDIPDGYMASQMSVNKFRNGIAYIPAYQYDQAYTNVNGAITPEKAYTVEFLSNGGSAVASQKVYESKKAERPNNPLRAGFTFAGWYTDSAYTKEYDFQLPVYQNLKLYAKWVESSGAKQLVLSFDGNGNTGGSLPDASEQKAAQEIKIPDTKPEKEGFTFSGWVSSYDGRTYQAGDSFSMPAASVELKAQWVSENLEKYTVLFNVDGGSIVFPLLDVEKGSRIARPEDPTKEFYTFEGWYIDEELQKEWNFSVDTVEADTTLYAKWLPQNEENKIQVGNDTQDIGQSGQPLSGLSNGGWGISNLLLALACFVLSALMTIRAVRMFYNLERRRGILLLVLSILSIAISLAALIIFLATSNLKASPSIIDRLTWLFVLITAVQGILLILVKGREENE